MTALAKPDVTGRPQDLAGAVPASIIIIIVYSLYILYLTRHSRSAADLLLTLTSAQPPIPPPPNEMRVAQMDYGCEEYLSCIGIESISDLLKHGSGLLRFDMRQS